MGGVGWGNKRTGRAERRVKPERHLGGQTEGGAYPIASSETMPAPSPPAPRSGFSCGQGKRNWNFHS